MSEQGKLLATHSHADCHFALSHGVHWATHERRFEDDVTRDPALCVGICCTEVDLPWEHEEVVVGETAMDGAVEEVCAREAVVASIRFQMGKSSGRVQIVFGAGSSVCWDGHGGDYEER